VGLDLGVEMAELGVAVWKLGTLVLLGGRLQAVAHLVPEHTRQSASQPTGA
jgi:hypothetical protein